MRNRIAAVAVAVGLAATGCNEDTCPTESPKLATVADCTVRPGATVNYQLQLCPTCNQTGATCDVDLSAAIGGDGRPGDIFLNPTVEACESANACPAGETCDTAVFTCTFAAPAVEGDYAVTILDADTGPVTRTLTVSTTASPSCRLIPI